MSGNFNFGSLISWKRRGPCRVGVVDYNRTGSCVLPSLLVRIGDGPVTRYAIEREALVIGRARSVDVRIDDPAVSRVHCQVSRTPAGRWMLQDFGSRNHTYLGDTPITQHELIHGDTFFVGPAKFVFSGVRSDGPPIPGDTTLPVEDRDELLMAEAGARFDGLAAEFRDQVDISDELASMVHSDAGDMTMAPDDPLQALADDATRVHGGECPLCHVTVLPGQTYCSECRRRLDAQRQAMQLRPQEKPSIWRRLFGR